MAQQEASSNWSCLENPVLKKILDQSGIRFNAPTQDGVKGIVFSAQDSKRFTPEKLSKLRREALHAQHRDNPDKARFAGEEQWFVGLQECLYNAVQGQRFPRTHVTNPISFEEGWPPPAELIRTRPKKNY